MVGLFDPWLLIAVLGSLGFPAVTSGTERTRQCTRPKRLKRCGSIPGPARSPGGGHDHPLLYFAWRISWTGETGGLPSTGSQRVRRDSSDLARMHTGFFGDSPQWFPKRVAKLSRIALSVRLQGQGPVSPHSWESSTPIKEGSFHLRFRGLPVYSSESWAWWSSDRKQPTALKVLLKASAWIHWYFSFLTHHLYHCFPTTFKLSVFS